jgi:hypothetical protein
MGELFDAVPVVEAEVVLHRATYAYRCEQCDRLHVYWEGIGQWPPTVYAPEPDAYPSI